MSNQILPGGSATIVIPATESVALFCQGRAQVLEQTGLVNYPTQESLLEEIDNVHTVLGPYSAGKTLRVVAVGDSPVGYEVGAAPIVKEAYRMEGLTGTPVAVDVTGDVSAAAILGGLVTSAAATVAGTVPTGAVMDAASEFDIGEGVEWSVIKTGANAFTVTSPGASHTIIGLAVVATATAGRFLTKKTAADTFITYRIG